MGGTGFGRITLWEYCGGQSGRGRGVTVPVVGGGGGGYLEKILTPPPDEMETRKMADNSGETFVVIIFVWI